MGSNNRASTLIGHRCWCVVSCNVPPPVVSSDEDGMTAVGGYGSSMSGVGRTVMPLLFFIFSFLTNTTSSGASPAAPPCFPSAVQLTLTSPPSVDHVARPADLSPRRRLRRRGLEDPGEAQPCPVPPRLRRDPPVRGCVLNRVARPPRYVPHQPQRCVLHVPQHILAPLGGSSPLPFHFPSDSFDEC